MPKSINLIRGFSGQIGFFGPSWSENAYLRRMLYPALFQDGSGWANGLGYSRSGLEEPFRAFLQGSHLFQVRGMLSFISFLCKQIFLFVKQCLFSIRSSRKSVLFCCLLHKAIDDPQLSNLVFQRMFVKNQSGERFFRVWKIQSF